MAEPAGRRAELEEEPPLADPPARERARRAALPRTARAHRTRRQPRLHAHPVPAVGAVELPLCRRSRVPELDVVVALLERDPLIEHRVSPFVDFDGTGGERY